MAHLHNCLQLLWLCGGLSISFQDRLVLRISARIWMFYKRAPVQGELISTPEFPVSIGLSRPSDLGPGDEEVVGEDEGLG